MTTNTAEPQSFGVNAVKLMDDLGKVETDASTQHISQLLLALRTAHASLQTLQPPKDNDGIKRIGIFYSVVDRCSTVVNRLTRTEDTQAILDEARDCRLNCGRLVNGLIGEGVDEQV